MRKTQHIVISGVKAQLVNENGKLSVRYGDKLQFAKKIGFVAGDAIDVVGAAIQVIFAVIQEKNPDIEQIEEVTHDVYKVMVY